MAAGLQNLESMTRELLELRRERDRMAVTLKALRLDIRSLAAQLAQLQVDASARYTPPGDDVFGYPEILVAKIGSEVAGEPGVYEATRQVTTGFHELADDAEDTDLVKVATIEGDLLPQDAVHWVMFAGLNPTAGGDEESEPIYHALAPRVVRAYQAVSDESGGTINIQAVNADGSLTGPVIVATVLP